ncbi:hypothetical protein Tco_1504986 [Tanacetum coccineum]
MREITLVRRQKRLVVFDALWDRCLLMVFKEANSLAISTNRAGVEGRRVEGAELAQRRQWDGKFETPLVLSRTARIVTMRIGESRMQFASGLDKLGAHLKGEREFLFRRYLTSNSQRGLFVSTKGEEK